MGSVFTSPTATTININYYQVKLEAIMQALMAQTLASAAIYLQTAEG